MFCIPKEFIYSISSGHENLSKLSQDIEGGKKILNIINKYLDIPLKDKEEFLQFDFSFDRNFYDIFQKAYLTDDVDDDLDTKRFTEVSGCGSFSICYFNDFGFVDEEYSKISSSLVTVQNLNDPNVKIHNFCCRKKNLFWCFENFGHAIIEIMNKETILKLFYVKNSGDCLYFSQNRGYTIIKNRKVEYENLDGKDFFSDKILEIFCGKKISKLDLENAYKEEDLHIIIPHEARCCIDLFNSHSLKGKYQDEYQDEDDSE